jgi:hypothetical protein
VAALVAILLAVAAASLAGCGAGDDPFGGVWWEPDTGRRIEIRRQDDGYRLLYGAEKRPFAAVREGDRLTITQPFGAPITIAASEDGTLRMLSDGRASVLRRVPEEN